MAEDRLLSDHIVPATELDPLPVTVADRGEFATILATTGREIVLSRARRDEEVRLLGRSALLLQVQADEDYLPRNRVPLHAFSETDWLMARPEEFRAMLQVVAASDCWFDWFRAEITTHDGAVRPDHPLIHVILERTQSASSLRIALAKPARVRLAETIIMPSWPPGSATPATQLARETVNALTFDLDRSLGAGQGASLGTRR